ncbi:MAG: methionyl-tRNA formyltransferase [Bacteroidetes bacterium]|nr:methionyl-tRNA formyltransferase [Bacteroidota bacterium]
MRDELYIVATIRPWNIASYHDKISLYPGNWHLITKPKDLTVEKIRLLKPKYIFFPHWSHIVQKEILNLTDCVCFHETDLPYGRGGSPIQNLISNGIRDTVVTAFKMSEELDAGPIYLKNRLSLEGLAEEIFIRISETIAEMIMIIITENPVPLAQDGEAVIFKRREPKQSRISNEYKSLTDLFDLIRMLDATDYPKAYFEDDNFRYEITRPALKTGKIQADVIITKLG